MHLFCKAGAKLQAGPSSLILMLSLSTFTIPTARQNLSPLVSLKSLRIWISTSSHFKTQRSDSIMVYRSTRRSFGS